MIQYLKRNEIDIEKYNQCIENSYNSRVYAYSWYLDIVADNWGVLVLNDYEAVMPLPWRSKYLIKYIYPPAWTQQLGIFSSKKIDEKLILKFIKSIPKKFKKVTIQFNSGNKFKNKNTVERVNYILSLDKSYEEIYKKIKRDRKHRLSQSLKENMSLIEGEIKDVVLLSKTFYSYLQISEDHYSLLAKLSELKNTFIISVHKKEELLGSVLFLIDAKRITYLFSVVSEKGRKKQVPSFIINHVIEKYSETNLVFDFEGSMIPGIASFFRSFGSEKEVYNNFKKIISF